MADARVRAVITAEDRASAVLGGVSSSFSKMAGAVAVGQLAVNGLTTAFSKLKDAGKFALQSASDFEQNRIAFETMLGSADKARKMLKQLSDFAARTPFELPEVVSGAKQLLAYGISADKILPTFKALGEIAAGVGKDKLPFLTLAFGQVATKGHLAGQEIRQFTEAGVPLIEQLAKVLGKTKDQIVAMSEAGDISFADVEKAIFSMSDQGGKFFNLMQRQSLTFGGVMSNLRDNFGRFARDLIGINDQGDIRQGSIFYYLERGAQSFLDWTNANRQNIVGFFNQLLTTGMTWGQGFIHTVGDAINWVQTQWEKMTNYIANDQRAQYVFDVIKGIMADITQVVRENLIPELKRLAQLLHPYLDDILKIVGAVAAIAFVGFIASLDVVIRLISKGIDLLNDFIGVFHKVKDTSDNFFSGLVSKIPGIKNIGRASGGPVTGGAPYIVGERGPELFVPSSSGQIVPNQKLAAGSGQNVTYNLSVNVGTFISTEMEKRKLAEDLWRALQDLQSARGMSMAQAVRV